MTTTLLGKTVKLAHPEHDEHNARYVVIEDNGDRLLIQFICDMPIPPCEYVSVDDVIPV